MTLVSTTITDRRGWRVDKLSRRQLEIDAAERRKPSADRLGQVRLRLVAISRDGFAQDRPRFGLHRPGMPCRAHAQALFDSGIDISDRQRRHVISSRLLLTTYAMTA